MRKYFAAALMAGGLFLGSVITTGIYHLMYITSMSAEAMEHLMHGRLFLWFWQSGMWSKYPALIPLSRINMLIETRAFQMTFPVILGVYYLLGYKRKYSHITVGAVCLAAGLLPYLTGRIALYNNIDPNKCGPLVAIMLIGMLYATTASLLFTALGLIQTKGASRKDYGLAERADDPPANFS